MWSTQDIKPFEKKVWSFKFLLWWVVFFCIFYFDYFFITCKIKLEKNQEKLLLIFLKDGKKVLERNYHVSSVVYFVLKLVEDHKMFKFWLWVTVFVVINRNVLWTKIAVDFGYARESNYVEFHEENTTNKFHSKTY